LEVAVAGPLFTLGHGTAQAAVITGLLRGAGIGRLVDVRTAPGSRHNADVKREAMQQWLPASGIEYRWERRLGGWRTAPAGSPDTALRNPSFAGYAAHMRTATFHSAIKELLAEAAQIPTAVLCSESLWWRCHRRLIADFVTLVKTFEVVHLMHDGRTQQHRLTEGVRLDADGLLVYDGGQGSLWNGSARGSSLDSDTWERR
jgi:uncharacterized protein (DUF488 family)